MLPVSAFGRERWTELNLGPFYIDFVNDPAAARDVLTQFEQVRWVLGGSLEIQDLRSLWPIRVVYEPSAGAPGEFIQRNGQFLLVCRPGSRPSLEQVTAILLEANTPRLPEEAQSGLLQLFGTLEAQGSHVSWGGPIPKPNLAWARMQLFATRFEYRASLHVLVASLKSGSSLSVAERNAFGKDPAVLEKEVRANLAAGNWQAVAVSGRPLDPKRDFGEHALDPAIADCYHADSLLESNLKAAETLYKGAIEAGGPAKAMGFAGLAEVARRQKEDPKPFLQNALDAGIISAPVDVALAALEPPQRALELLKRAAALNPLWAVPIYEQARLATDPAVKETLLRKAVQIDPRATTYWLELAQLQTTNGHAIEAQGSWLRAEDSAGTAAEKERIHQMRMDIEQKRLDAADEERVRERDAAHADDQRAQDNEAAAIRAAEEKANRENDVAAGDDKPADVVPWDAMLPQRKLSGMLTQVDCLRGGKTRLIIQERSGKTTSVLGDSNLTTALSCGTQQPPKKVSISYAADPDQHFRTAGRLVNLQLQ